MDENRQMQVRMKTNIDNHITTQESINVKKERELEWIISIYQQA